MLKSVRTLLRICLPALLVAGCLPALEPLGVLELKGTTYHVQGIAVEASRLWVSSVESAARKGYLHEFSLPDGKLVRTVEVQDGARFHPGGISADAASIWLPVAEYRRASSSLIQQRSKRTLAVESQFEVADHIGCLAVKGEELIGANWDSRTFYVWNRAGRLLRQFPNPAGNSYQDLKFDGGQLVGGGLLADRSGAVDWLEYPELRLVTRVPLGKTDRGVTYTREGLAVRGDEFLLLPEDGPSRLFFFRKPGR